MNKKFIIFIIVLIAVLALIYFAASSKELDRIENYTITVTPQDDGTLNMIYDIKWKVLDSTTEGPLEWVQIGIPNENVDNITALSNNIESIEQYNSTYVKIVFKNSYEANEVVNFRYKIHQKNMYTLEGSNCKYEFTPGWFKDIAVDNISVKWKANSVSSANTETRENGFYVWQTSLKKNEKLKVELEYPQEAFSGLTSSGENYNSSNYTNNINGFGIIGLLIVIAIISIFIGMFSSDGYERHRGYGGTSYYRSSCVSSCACVNSCACACACAGGGRAGCSKKDFYGTKLKSKDILKKL